jgi:hypothetical protein
MSFARWVSQRIDRLSTRRLRGVVATAIGVLMFGLITHGHYAASGDAVHYLVISHSVAFDGDLDVTNDYADPLRYVTDAPERHALPGRDGVLRPVHDVGFPVLAAPFVGLAYRLAAYTDQLPESFRRKSRLSDAIAFRQLVSLFMIALTVTLALSFLTASWRLTGLKGAAAAMTLIWALSAPILTHGYIFLTEIPTALVALAIYLRLDGVRGATSRRTALTLGLLTGLLLLIHVRNVGLVLVFAYLVLWRLPRMPRPRAAFLGGLGAMFAIKVGLNLLFWGTLLTTPHEHFAAWPGVGPFVAESATRVMGLLFDARHGLLWSAPIYLLAPAALILVARQSRGAAVELTLIVAAYLFFVINPVTNAHGWRGGWSPAARFLVPVTPFLAIGLPALLRSRAGTIVTSAVIAVQIVISAFLWAHPILTFSEGPGPAPWLQWLAGKSFAAAIPVWETLTPSLLAIGTAAFAGWWFLTRVVTRAEDWRAS